LYLEKVPKQAGRLPEALPGGRRAREGHPIESNRSPTLSRTGSIKMLKA
jgi:hypothetical protein